jgi:hypothetical protein
MIEAIVGNKTMEKVLLFMEQYGKGYSKQISDTFAIPLNMVQKQLKRLELGGVVVSSLEGKTRTYTWNPRYAFAGELRALLRKTLSYIPDEEQKKYFRARTRPRRAGKPL